MKNILQQTILLSFLILTCLSADQNTTITPVTPTTTVTPSPPSNQSTSSSRIFVFINGNPNQNLQAYDVKNLSQPQQQVNKFIRSRVKVGDSNLTDARGDGNTFVYTYENKTDKSEQIWVITVRANHISDENKSQGNNGTNPQNIPQQKYVIIGINSISNNIMTEQQKAQLKQKFEKQQRKMQKEFNKFQNKMNQFGNQMDDFGQQMSQLGNIFGKGTFLGFL